MRRTLLTLISLSFVVSCATVQTADPELRRKAATVQILSPEELNEREYDMLGEVVGLSCARQTGSDPSMEGARQEMRVEAAKVDADAVINSFCEEGGMTFAKNCWKTIECRGDAIKWKE